MCIMFDVPMHTKTKIYKTTFCIYIEKKKLKKRDDKKKNKNCLPFVY